jgi:hypothetical protein
MCMIYYRKIKLNTGSRVLQKEWQFPMKKGF